MNVLKMQIPVTIPDPAFTHPRAEKLALASIKEGGVVGNRLEGLPRNRHANKTLGLIKILAGADLQILDPTPLSDFLGRCFRVVKIF